MENMSAHAEDATDMMEVAAAAMDMRKENAAATETADADATDILQVDENGSCHIELEYGGFSQEIPSGPHTLS